MTNITFDPGYSSCILGVSENVGFIYNAFVNQPMNLKQRKFQFSMLLPRIKSLIKKNASFYLGCLLWAVYIKSIKDGELNDNPCLNQEFKEEESLEEVNFLIKFINEILGRDAKYYLNLTLEKDERSLKILDCYSDFLKINNGFTKTEKTNEIQLPNIIKNPTEKELVKIKEKIDEAIGKKDLMLLYDVYELILD